MNLLIPIRRLVVAFVAAMLLVQPPVQAQETAQLGVGFSPDQFALIQAGSFEMGAPDQAPVHTVNITRSFYLQKTEVTQGQWEIVMGTNPSHFSDCGSRCPVEQVSWNDIQGFLTTLNALYPGKNYRLPTEAEWEYAARAGTAGDYSGSNAVALGWYEENSGDRTHLVGQKQANAWGLYDIHGNVWEWVQDQFGEYPTGPVSDPAGPVSGGVRVLRGGSWASPASHARSAARSAGPPDERFNSLGFRLAMSR